MRHVLEADGPYTETLVVSNRSHRLIAPEISTKLIASSNIPTPDCSRHHFQALNHFNIRFHSNLPRGEINLAFPLLDLAANVDFTFCNFNQFFNFAVASPQSQSTLNHISQCKTTASYPAGVVVCRCWNCWRSNLISRGFLLMPNVHESQTNFLPSCATDRGLPCQKFAWVQNIVQLPAITLTLEMAELWVTESEMKRNNWKSKCPETTLWKRQKTDIHQPIRS